MKMETDTPRLTFRDQDLKDLSKRLVEQLWGVARFDIQGQYDLTFDYLRGLEQKMLAQLREFPGHTTVDDLLSSVVVKEEFCDKIEDRPKPDP